MDFFNGWFVIMDLDLDEGQIAGFHHSRLGF